MRRSGERGRAVDVELNRLDREVIAIRRHLGRGPHHDPVQPLRRPSAHRIRNRTGIALLAVLATLVLLVGWGMVRFVLWFGGLMVDGVVPTPLHSAAQAVIDVAEILAGVR